MLLINTKQDHSGKWICLESWMLVTIKSRKLRFVDEQKLVGQ